MKLKASIETDVLVMGAGLAGIMSAISAAEAGARVCLVSSTRICSGSSFYPGTWGFGLIGPEHEDDQTDLEETIIRVGEGMADPELVKTLVSHIHESITYLKKMGIHLKKARQKTEREFIPCFDYKNRDWNGINQEEARRVFLKKIEELDIVCLSDTEIIQCTMDNGRVSGAVSFHKEHGFCFLSCKSMVIASGGMGGIFEYRLNTDDINGMGQYIGLMAGTELVNIEFIQMMPGFVSPAPKTIYNEKVFRYSEFCYPGTGISLFQDWTKEETERLLEIRSTHGPFTSRLDSKAVDERLFEQFLHNKEGITVSYKEEIWDNQPEFVRNYFEWLVQEKHLTIKNSVQLGIFAHASNGGIRIDSFGATKVKGLFACGEATGEMHGADRLGGLSTANGLVFGRIAGISAASYSKGVRRNIKEVVFEPELIKDAKSYLAEIRMLNFECAMISRDEIRAEAAISRMEVMKGQMELEKQEVESFDEEFLQIRDTYRLKAAITLSSCLMRAVKLRRESRGSHYRTDCPELHADLGMRIICSYGQSIYVEFE